MTYDSHLSFIKTIAAQSPNQLLFKLPILESSEPNSEGHTIPGRKNITYSQFLSDVERLAKYWLKVLGYSDGHNSTVGLWMAGMTYTDVVHLFSLMMAGFVPHILDLNFQVTDIVVDLFTESQASAIICDPTAPTNVLIQSSFKVYTIMALDKLVDKALDSTPLPTTIQEQAGDDIIILYHTSGSTSERPKIVKHTRQWIDINAKKSDTMPTVPDGKEVALRLSTFSHTSQFLFAQTSSILNQILRAATTNPELELTLKSLKFIVHTGTSIGEEESKWAIKHGIPLRDLLGSTETGFLMSSLTNNTILYPLQLPGTEYEFWPVDGTRVGLTRSGLYKLELVVPRVSVDCPQPSSCEPGGGHYRTKDLFEEVHPGAYQYLCRVDDMIKMENASICDTRYIENQVSNTCKDLISRCVVVGSNRPSPVLLVEPLLDDIDKTKLKEEIGEKVQLINKNSYSHERIDPSHILIVQRGGLPWTLTKNNIRRSAAEDVFKEDIDRFFSLKTSIGLKK
ncbi:hypothetical protein Clacol_007956 [Clathrus columnatus]|uniref:AMP-dependent synthetase/ligase domain-containing protein n=1 Tax=Clathrus columnatus TaxID=1419009 RepID=A0AAV5ALE9_9AGAM|nr:hypothetical protein Clacol_007956 [Clathrus columnatus]